MKNTVGLKTVTNQKQRYYVAVAQRPKIAVLCSSCTKTKI